MRLAKLTLSGFKSFADRTEFEFDDAVTGIVGPNGCGKSNVVDAIKWVLGERSSKSLRGKEMMDVIFAGSAGRKPAGMASVMLTFENPELEAERELTEANEETTESEGETETDTVIDRRVRTKRALPLDADVVEVERRLYRDGTSKYLINGKTARLKDIRGLFLDTGIGADAYSIIEQGKVDAMLLASPQERRNIFEEAAGVARYRQQRTEATRKLDKTERNLTQLREQLASTERRLRLVRGQASKARRFVELDAELNAWRTALLLDQHHDLVERVGGLTSRLESLSTERNDSIERVTLIEESKLEADTERSELIESRRTIEQSRDQATHQAQAATQSITHLESTRKASAERIEADEERIEAMLATIEDLRSQAESAASKRESFEADLEAAEHDRSKAQSGKSNAERELAEKRRTRDEHLSAASRIERERLRLEASSDADARRLESIDEERTRANDREAEIQSETSTRCDSLDENERTLEEQQHAADTLESRATDLRERAGSLVGDRGELAEEVSSLREELVKLETRRATLDELIASRSDLGEATRDLLDRAESDDPAFRAILGTLSDLIDARSMPAELELALGSRLDAVVFDSSKGWPPPRALSELTGRVTMIPLQARIDAPLDVPQPLLGSLVALRDAAQPADGPNADAVAVLLDRLLGKTFLTRSLESARLLAAGPLPGCRFVTADGIVLEPDGSVIVGAAGGANENTGLLQRKLELREIEQRLEHTRSLLDARRSRLETLDTEAATLENALGDVLREHADAERTLGRTTAARDRLQGEIERLETDLARARADSERLESRREEIERDRAQSVEKAASLARLEAEQRELAASIGSGLEEHERTLEQAAAVLAELAVKAGTLREQADGAARDEASAQTHLDRITRDECALRAATEQTRAEIESCSERISRHQQEREASLERAESQSKELEGVLRGIEEADGRVGEIAEMLRIARERAGQLDRDWHSLEVSRRELEIKREGLIERAMEECSLDLERDADEYRWLLAHGGVEPVEHANATRVVGELKSEIKKLGNVNLDAINEETTLDEATSSLATEVEDLDEARVRLTELIERLNDLSKSRFAEAFDRIRAEFGGKNGMFRQLFGGGHAEVRLMPLVKEVDGEKVVTDIIDPLESGVEVIAKPPGKEPRSISQLSGGEKTMTAVALLLSIFRSKPSCFCILDEVDAALDDSNVERFARVVRRYTDKSHFIVITHNKRTMNAADRLFGVTMQERGVSTRVAVRFGQAQKQGAPEQTSVAIDPDTFADGVDEPEAKQDASPRPSNGLRAALASMRESPEPAEISN